MKLKVPETYIHFEDPATDRHWVFRRAAISGILGMPAHTMVLLNGGNEVALSCPVLEVMAALFGCRNESTG
jgi:hypothetical protein